MELQELALKAVSSQLRYSLSPRFPDIRGRFIEELTAQLELPEWGWGDEYVTFTNPEQALTLVAGGRDVRTQFEYVVDAEDVVSTTRTLFSKAMADFGVREVTFVGVRTYWAASSDDFDALRDWLQGFVFAEPMIQLLQGVGHVSDLGWVLEFMHEDPKHRVQIGPMTREQLMNQLRNAREDDFPEAFFFMDFDRIYNETTVAADEATDRWEQSFRRNLELASQFGQGFTGVRPFA